MVDETKTPDEGLETDRRDFLTLGAAAGAVAVLGAAGCAPAGETAGEGAGESPAPFDLAETSIRELQGLMEAEQLTARDITQRYLDRIAEVDGRLRSVLETNPEALDIADELDRERAAGSVRGPLHGIPILLKDNIDTADRMTTTAGSLALEGAVAPTDSHVAARLREAGAILLGKANLSEWANFRSERSSSGWSGRGGQCGNPYALDRSPCGSSSGSGAAASGNLCAAAIGTETNGSIVCPASASSLVGFKPTVGLWGRSGIIPISHSQDTAGPMARSVEDAAILLGAVSARDERDSATRDRGEVHADYTAFLDADGLEGARIGVLRSSFGFHEKVDALLEAALATMQERGAVLVDPVEIDLSGMGGASYEVLLYEFKDGLDRYLSEKGDAVPVGSLAEVIAFNEAQRGRSMPYFEQEILRKAQAKGGLDSLEYREALATAQRLTRDEGIDRAMDEHRLDAIFAVTGGPPWRIDLVNGDHFGGGSSTPAAVSGYPNVTVPGGYVQGLPVGVNFFGRAWSESTLLRIAYAYEQATKHRVEPTLPSSLELGAPIPA